MSDCKCKNILNLQPICQPTLDIQPQCPTTLNIEPVNRGPKGNDATINGLPAINIDATGGLVGVMDEQTSTFSIDGSAKQDVISDLSEIRQGAELGATSVQNVTTGLAKGTISVDGVNVSVNGLDTAAYTSSSDYATSAQGALADTAVQPDDLATVATTGSYSDLIDKPTNYVTTNTTQTISGEKVFSGILSIPAGKTYIIAGNGGAKLGYFTYDIDGFSNITLQTMTASNRDINFKTNNSGKVKYNGNEVAIKSQIPTQASDIGALPDTTTISDLVSTAQLNALNSGATTTNIGQITTNENDISDINDKIPSQASSSNQLADKNFVNSSIATNTANFIGTFNSVAELEAYSGTLTNNDYAFVQTTDTAGNTLYDRYKWNGSEWLFEYELNNSSFTAEQWATINSGATSSDVALAQSALQSGDNVSELVNDAGYITSASLPTVNDATLTIQKNGTSVGTFTANASSNVTANITVPTDTSDLTNGAGFITGITSSDVTTALGYTPYDSTNPSGYISGITSGDVTTALGYTPADDSNVVKLTGDQTISGTKKFNSSLTRTSTIDPSTTTGETEVRTLSTVTNNGSTVIASYNATRSATTFSNRQRVNNPNLSNAWYDIRVNVNDAGQAYVNCTGSSSLTNLSMTQATSSTGSYYIPTMGWVNNPSTSTNVVHRSGTETITGNKTFSGANTFSGNNSFTGDNTFTKQIYGTLASYSAVNGSSNATPYKKIAECVITGGYQSVVIPFIYTMTTTVTTSNTYTGKITFRTDSTAGTASGTRGVSLGVSPNFINNGDFEFYVCHQNNYPESNQVTFQLWVYVKNTYQGVNVIPLRQGTGGVNYSTSNVTWGNALDEQASLPAEYTVTNQIFTDNYSKTPTDDNTTSTQIDTVGARNTKLQSYVSLAGTETISGNKDFTGTVTAVTQSAGDNSTKVATTAYVENAVSASGGVPTGSILPFGGSSAPTGFLLCDGSAVSRTDYADLFDVIGTTYGSGDGSTTFNVPNLSTAVLPSTSTVDVMGNGNALAIVDDLSTEAKQHNALVVGSGSSSFSTAKVPFAEFNLANPLAVGDLASNANEFGTVKKALGVSTLPQWSGLTGSITGVTLNYIIKA